MVWKHSIDLFNPVMSTIKIPLSKVKLVLLLLGCILFVIFGVLILQNPEQYELPRFGHHPGFVKGVGYLAAMLFGIIGAYVFLKLFDKKPGLMLDATGITDNSSGTSIGLIEWRDVTGIETTKFMSNKFVLVFTDQPNKYIGKARNRMAKSALSSNLKTFKTPLSISANSLKISHDELEKLLLVQWSKYKMNE